MSLVRTNYMLSTDLGYNMRCAWSNTNAHHDCLKIDQLEKIINLAKDVIECGADEQILCSAFTFAQQYHVWDKRLNTTKNLKVMIISIANKNNSDSNQLSQSLTDAAHIRVEKLPARATACIAQ